MGYLCLRLDTHPGSMQAAKELYRRLGSHEVADPVPQVDGPVLSGIVVGRPNGARLGQATLHVSRIEIRHFSNK
jgi:hypothetical protein